jgi:hypothetical protein
MLDIDVSHTFLDIGINALTAMQKDFQVLKHQHFSPPLPPSPPPLLPLLSLFFPAFGGK